MTPHLEALGALLVDSTAETFEASIPASAKGDTRAFAASPPRRVVVTFGGDALRGAVSLEVAARLLRATHPCGPASSAELDDWASELANVVVGMLKRKLRARGVRIRPGLPRAARPSAPPPPPSPHAFEHVAAAGDVRVRLEAHASPGFCLEESRPDGVDAVMLFNDGDILR